MYIIVVGNPIDGTNMFGPFNTSEDALWYGENNYVDEDWWMVELITPED